MSRSKRNAAAADYFDRAPNYSAEAISCMRSEAPRWMSRYPIASAFVTVLADLLEESHKFALPSGGRLFAAGIEESMIEAFHLPYDVCAFEFDAVFTTDDVPDRFHVHRVPKRIALCWDSLAMVKRGEKRLSPPLETEPGCVVWPIDFDPRDGRWFPSWIGATVPYQQTPSQVDREALAPLRARLESWGVKTQNLRDRKSTYRCGFVPLGDLGREILSRREPDEARYGAHVDTIEEVTAAFHACAALSCTNVTTEILRPNREAHAIRPASTLFDYHILVLDPSRVHEPGEPLGGSHSSPRTHLRRGHIRRHPTAGRIWVNSCVVNPTAIGTVNKDYSVRRGGGE